MFGKFFKPESVTLVGASREPQKLGFQILQNLIGAGLPGKIYPVNPKASEVLGLKCYNSVTNLPETPDLAIIVLPSAYAVQSVEECGKKGIKAIVVISAGFKEAGAEGKVREEKLKELADRYGCRIIGPNCLGIIDTYTKLNASFAPFMPDKGEIAFISQSGAIICAVLDWAKKENIGFSRVISLGNMADLSEAELIEDCAADVNTKVILLYMEGVKNGKDFVKRVSKITKKKPVIALKSGQTAAGSKAVSSHTGSLAGLAQAYTAAFQKSGVIQVMSMSELFDTSLLFAFQPVIKNDRIALLTNAGGPAVMATDAVEKQNLKLAVLSGETQKNLKSKLPPAANTNNPVDVLGDATEEVYGYALEELLKDGNVDGVVTILTPQVITRPLETAGKIVSISRQYGKTVAGTFMGGMNIDVGVRHLMDNKIPNYNFPERAVQALKNMFAFNVSLKKEHKYKALALKVDKTETAKVFESVRQTGKKFLADFQASGILKNYGINGPKTFLAKTVNEAVENSSKVGFPMAAKIVSADVLHKTEAGGVKINIKTAAELETAYKNILESVKKSVPGAKIEGIELQEMVTGVQEVIIGVKKDPQFGHMIMFGLGGIFVELLKDVVFRMVPVDAEEAMSMITGIKAAKLLQGYRKLPEADTGAIADIIARVSALCENHPEIAELDINPLVVKEKGKGAVMVDARIILE